MMRTFIASQAFHFLLVSLLSPKDFREVDMHSQTDKKQLPVLHRSTDSHTDQANRENRVTAAGVVVESSSCLLALSCSLSLHIHCCPGAAHCHLHMPGTQQQVA